MTEATDFSVGETIVHPAHGVGRIERIGPEFVAGEQIGVIQIALEDRFLRVKVPVQKTERIGLRRLASPAELAEALDVVRQKPRASRGTWARRAADYHSKINSGQPRMLAEVVRDLRRGAMRASFSERQIFERALDRLSAELAAQEGVERAAVRSRLLALPEAA
jgi:CarD family transcriptional regulator